MTEGKEEMQVWSSQRGVPILPIGLEELGKLSPSLCSLGALLNCTSPFSHTSVTGCLAQSPQKAASEARKSP